MSIRRIAIAALALALALVPRQAVADLTYTVQDYPSLESGYTISGTITTDGNIGTLYSLDLVDWAITISEGSTGVLSLTGQNSYEATQSLTATETALSIGSSGASIEFALSGNGPPNDISWVGYTTTVQYAADIDGSTAWSASAPSPFTVATAPTAVAVPEPSSALAASFAALAGLGVWARGRRPARRAAPARP